MSNSSNNFSKALQKYYTRKGNRFIFSNGMTLNQLAWEMWERLGYQGIDPSVLSRVVNGSRLFTSDQLFAFCHLLKLSKTEVAKLEQILFLESPNHLFKDSFFISNTDDFISLIETEADSINLLVYKDLSAKVINWTRYLLEQIPTLLITISSPTKRSHVLELESKLLKSYMCELLLTEKAAPALLNIKEVSGRLIEVASEIKDRKSIAYARSYEGDALYINGDYQLAAKLIDSGIKMGLSEFPKLVSLRALAISYATLKKEGAFEEIKKLMLKNLSSRPLYESVFILDGIARAEEALGNTKEVRYFLEDAWRIYGSDRVQEDSFFRATIKMSVIRTELEVAHKEKGSVNPIKIEKLGNEALDIAKKCGHSRYETIIKKHLSQIL